MDFQAPEGMDGRQLLSFDHCCGINELLYMFILYNRMGNPHCMIFEEGRQSICLLVNLWGGIKVHVCCGCIDANDITSLVGDLFLQFYFYLFILQSSNATSRKIYVQKSNIQYHTHT